jgi:hypothetical protein
MVFISCAVFWALVALNIREVSTGMKEFLIVTLLVAAAYPALIATTSFMMMQNCFRVLGAGYIVRATIVLEVIAWILMATPLDGAS